MKRLLLLRHAKSDWGADYDADHERPLAPRGQRAALLIGEFLARNRQVPERIVSSTATRARETVRLAQQAGGWDCPVEETRGLYETSPESVLRLLQRQDDACAALLVAGHEPTWSLLAGALVGGGALRMPTAALARIDFDVESWSELEYGAGTLAWLVTPKLLARFRG